MARKKPKKPKKDKKKMADYEFKYRMTDNTKATHNGGSQIQHNIRVIAREQSTSDPYEEVGLERTIFIPASDTITALGLSTPAEVRAAYKQLILDNSNSVLQSMSLSGWGNANLEAWVDANDLAQEAADTFEAYLTAQGWTYPLDFTL